MSPNSDRLCPEEDLLLRSELCRMAAAEQPLTVRALYYRAVLNPVLPFITKDTGNDRRNERLVQSRCLALRRSGEMPWSWIVDPSRASYSTQRFASPADFAAVAPWYYDRDLWAGQTDRPIVLIEKVAAVGTIQRHCRDSGVEFWATKGYSSASQVLQIAEYLEPVMLSGQAVTVAVLADFDPSGCDWPRAAEEDLRQQLRRLGHDHEAVTFERLLMTPAQASGLGQSVALRAPSDKDARTDGFLERYGFGADDEVCVELDALAPTEIRGLLSELFDRLHAGSLAEEQAAQEADRERIRQALEAVA